MRQRHAGCDPLLRLAAGTPGCRGVDCRCIFVFGFLLLSFHSIKPPFPPKYLFNGSVCVSAAALQRESSLAAVRCCCCCCCCSWCCSVRVYKQRIYSSTLHQLQTQLKKAGAQQRLCLPRILFFTPGDPQRCFCWSNCSSSTYSKRKGDSGKASP